MSIRNRIFKSNTWIVLLSLFSLLIIGGTVIYIFEDTYYKSLAKNAILQDNAYDAQTLINNYKFPSKTITNADYDQLISRLHHYEYQLYLLQNNKKIFSNLHHNQKETLDLIRPKITFSNKSELYVWENKTIITRKSSDYEIIAIHGAEKEGIFKLNTGTFELLILSFLIVGIASILVIMLISRLFTQQLVNKIMIPIHKLIEGAGRIEQGNLDEQILYEGEDEFEMVCRSFNHMQESLKAGIEKNVAYEKARTDMISGISHDLRTPLTSVKGYIKGVKDGVANTPEKQDHYLNIAYKKACEMDVLLQKLFYFSKLETGNMPLYPVKTDLLAFLKEFIRENDEHYKENKLEVTLSVQEKNDNVLLDQRQNYDVVLDSKHKYEVQLDQEQFSRVIANIVDNSIKYRIRDSINFKMELNIRDSKVILTLTDDGAGVPEEKLPHLFEQFYRADEARSGKRIGSGLGLYITKYIIEQHGGSISARNNGGLSIEIILPKCEK